MLLLAPPAAAGTPRIIGGTTATPGAWPSAAFIQDTAGDSLDSCSGAVIAPNVVLTAAHCVVNEATQTIEPLSGLRVYTGSNDWTTAPWSSGVDEISVYPDFSETTVGSSDYDIAVLELITATKAPVMALATPAETSLYTAGESVSQVGWGVTSTDPGAAENDSLQQASAVLQSSSTCTADDQVSSGNVFDSGDQVCTLPEAATSQGACFGDSGGPLLVNSNGSWTELGLAIYTSSCDPSQPDYYTSVAAFSRWLHNQIMEMPLPAEWGTYRGRTTQGWRVTLKLNQSSVVTDFKFGFTMRCQRGSHGYTWEPLDKSYTWSLNKNFGVGFDHSTTDSTGTHYTFKGLFTSTGRVSGTLRATWHSPQYGFCSTGLVKWSAH
jgi:secreted trypsin-like serine protease